MCITSLIILFFKENGMEILWIWQNNLRITLSLFTLHPILLEALKSVINNNTHFVPEIYTSGGINLLVIISILLRSSSLV